MHTTNERHPILTHFLLLTLAWWTASSALYLWLAGVGWAEAGSRAMARLFVIVGLPFNSIVPVQVGGKFWQAGQLLRVTAAHPTVVQASEWMLLYLPLLAALLAAGTLYFWRKTFPALPINLVRGTVFVPRR